MITTTRRPRDGGFFICYNTAMTTRARLDSLASEPILVLDGAMGTMIQRFALSEEDFRGERFAAHQRPLKGCNDLLVLTRPDVVASIHQAYLRAGADIIETCSFNANSVSLADYGLSDFAYEINAAAASWRAARASAWWRPASTPSTPRPRSKRSGKSWTNERPRGFPPTCPS